MAALYRFQPFDVIPDDWAPATAYRGGAAFRANLDDTLALLSVEIGHLDGEALIQVATDERSIRLDGRLKANRPQPWHPGVIVTITTDDLGVLVYRCDRYGDSWRMRGWEANLRAIALGLGALRQIDRYGITNDGAQYAGFRALPTTSASPAEQAAAFIAEAAGIPVSEFAGSAEAVRRAVRAARKRLHPDAGGTAEAFTRLTEQATILLEAIGG